MNAHKITGSENCLPVGTRLHDFEITGVLGEGGFGIVYIAFDHSLQRSVAIKEYMPGVLAARGSDHGIRVRAERHKETFDVGLKSFINEARFLAQFDHPSLVKVYRFWEQNHTAYTAMQYYEGRTIKDIVNNSPEAVTEEWCRRVLKQILEALEMLYTMRILHRDISPDNIIVQDNGDAVLLDFGSARQIIGDRTRGLTVILKPGYAPVEQYAGDASLDQGAYTDIYALSAVIYFAMFKEPPATSIARMVKDPMVALAGRGLTGFSLAFLQAIDKGLAVMANDRPQTIDAFRELLGIAPPGPARTRPANEVPLLNAMSDAPPALPFLNTVTGPVLKKKRDGEASSSRSGSDRRNGDKGSNSSSSSAAGSGARSSSSSARGGDKSGTRSGSKSGSSAAATPAGLLGKIPSWAPRAALALALFGMIGLGAAWLLDSSSNVVLPAAQVDTAAGPDDAAEGPAVADGATEAAPQQAAAGSDKPADAGADIPSETPAATVTVASDKPAQTETSNYKLSVKPWGTVYVDGVERGVSPPLKKLILPAGKHKIRIANPGFPDYVTEVNLAKNKSGTIEHDFAADSK